MQQRVLISLCALTLSSAGVAAVSEQEASRLDKDLTPMGAERAGNADGSIPAWSGKVLGVPPGVNYKGTGTHYPNPYPNEKPLFIITAQNYQQYSKNLTEGQLALFKKYPTFAMHVYPTKRDTRYSDKIYKNVRYNATHAKLSDDGNIGTDVFNGPGFPIPSSPYHILWNHIAAPMMSQSEITADNVAVWKTGERTERRDVEQRYVTYYSDKLSRDQFNQQNVGAMVIRKTIAPAREAGQVLLVHESKDMSATGRNAWMYLPGNRRVRRAPSVGFDFPNGPGGLSTVDDALLFNGSNERFDWKYEGKREVFIPYNNYELDDTKWSFDELLTVGHVNPKAMRWELHRVHVVSGTLKAGKRHVYGKRRLYTVEDSWHAVLSDNFDANGTLWRTNLRTMVNMYDLPGVASRTEMYHDLQKEAYLVNYLINKASGPARYVPEGWSDAYFSPGALRSSGK